MSDVEGKVVTLPSAQQIESEAASWLVVLGREQVSAEDRMEFKRWLRQSERHRTAFESLSAMWGEMEILKELEDIGEAMIQAPVSRTPLIQTRGFLAAAASVLMVIAAGGAFYANYLRGLNQVALFETGVGEQRIVELSDGSSVELNTDTSVQIAFTRGERAVKLARGEAHFAVAKDKRRPFAVTAGSTVVAAVGTAFTVRRREGDLVEVTVEEGTVALASSQPPAVTKETSPDSAPLAHLTAGQSVMLKESVETVQQLPKAELDRKLAWRKGVLVYSGEPLQEVIAEISRYTDIEIEIADPALAAKPVAGYFPVSRIDGLFQALQLNFGIHVERVDATHVRLSSAP